MYGHLSPTLGAGACGKLCRVADAERGGVAIDGLFNDHYLGPDFAQPIGRRVGDVELVCDPSDKGQVRAFDWPASRQHSLRDRRIIGSPYEDHSPAGSCRLGIVGG